MRTAKPLDPWCFIKGSSGPTEATVVPTEPLGDGKAGKRAKLTAFTTMSQLGPGVRARRWLRTTIISLLDREEVQTLDWCTDVSTAESAARQDLAPERARQTQPLDTEERTGRPPILCQCSANGEARPRQLLQPGYGQQASPHADRNHLPRRVRNAKDRRAGLAGAGVRRAWAVVHIWLEWISFLRAMVI